jgi:hypothetical protein
LGVAYGTAVSLVSSFRFLVSKQTRIERNSQLRNWNLETKNSNQCAGTGWGVVCGAVAPGLEKFTFGTSRDSGEA